MACLRLTLPIMTVGDSWSAYNGHSGVTRPAMHYLFWPGVTFYNGAEGSANASGDYGTTTGAGGVTQFYITSKGHTAEGCLSDRLHAKQALWSLPRYEYAIAGSLAGAWGGDQITRYNNNITPSYWDGVIPALQAMSPGDRLAIFVTWGGNDLFPLFTNALVDPTYAPGMALWDNTYIPGIKTNMAAAMEFLVSHIPSGVLVDIIWPTYTNMRVQDGTPISYRPHGDTYDPTKAPFRCVWFTAGFGAYTQASNDNLVRQQAWANVKKLSGPNTPTTGPFGPTNQSLNYNYWLCRIQYGFCVTTGIGALGQDLVGAGGLAHALDPLIWQESLKNITQESINNIFHKLGTAQAEIALEYQVGHSLHRPNVNVIQIDTYTGINGVFPPDSPQTSGAHGPVAPAQYLAPGPDAYADTIHLSTDGFNAWSDYIISQWFPRSQFADLSCVPTAVDDSFTVVGGGTPVTVSNVTANDILGDTGTWVTSSVQVFNPTTSTWGAGFTVAGQGTWSVVGPAITFTPVPAFVGNPTVQYRVRDTNGVYASAHVNGAVTPPVPPAPPPVINCTPQTNVFVP